MMNGHRTEELWNTRLSNFCFLSLSSSVLEYYFSQIFLETNAYRRFLKYLLFWYGKFWNIPYYKNSRSNEANNSSRSILFLSKQRKTLFALRKPVLIFERNLPPFRGNPCKETKEDTKRTARSVSLYRCLPVFIEKIAPRFAFFLSVRSWRRCFYMCSGNQHGFIGRRARERNESSQNYFLVRSKKTGGCAISRFRCHGSR